MMECPRALNDGATIACYHRKGAEMLGDDDCCQGCGWPLYALVEERDGGLQVLLKTMRPGAGDADTLK